MRKLGLPVALLAFVACSDVPTRPTAPLRAAPDRATSFSRGTTGALIPNQYIVRFKDTESNVPARGREIEGLYGAKVQREYVAAIKGVLVNLADQAAPAVAANPNVIAIEQDQTVSLNATQTGATWGLDRIDQRMLPLSTTYSYTPDGTGVTVYIIDTGINFTHSEYAGRAFFGTDVGPNGSNTSGADCNGHGSHVSGTVGGTTYGVAKNVKLVAVRVLDCGGSGIVWRRHRRNRLGATQPDPPGRREHEPRRAVFVGAERGRDERHQRRCGLRRCRGQQRGKRL